MKKVLLVICVLFLFGFVDAVLADVDINISGSSFEILDEHSFKVRNVTSPGSPGLYWITFQWDAVKLVYLPVVAGEELRPTGKTWSWNWNYFPDYFSDTYQYTLTSDPDKRTFRVTYQTLKGTWYYCRGDTFIQGNRQYDLQTSPLSIDSNSALITYDGVFDGCSNIYEGQPLTATITDLPEWFDFTKTFAVQFYDVLVFCEPDGTVHQ